MKKNIFKIILSIITIITSIVFCFYIFQDVMKIYDMILLKWVPMITTFIGFYLAGIITKKIKLKYVWGLLFCLLIFLLIRLFYFPLVAFLVFFAILGIMLNRKEIKKELKIFFSITGVLIFVFFLFNQPLIIKQNEFGRDTNGNLINAKLIWNFRDYKPNKTPNELFNTLNNQKTKLTDFKGKTLYVTFWATWCGPCLAEKPILNKLKETFKNNSKIIFIDICINTNIDNWKLYLKNNTPSGLQLISENPNLTRRNFELDGIPAHIIINEKFAYKKLPWIPAAEKFLKNEELMNKWIESERLIVEQKD